MLKLLVVMAVSISAGIWFESLTSKSGRYCDETPLTILSEATWESSGTNHYRVFVDERWYDVPDDALVTETNKYGRAMVWPVRTYYGIVIRCFIPGMIG